MISKCALFRRLVRTRNNKARLALKRPGAELNVLRGLFQVSGEGDNLPTLLWWYPFHFRFETCRNVKLNHLCHNQPPIHSRMPVFVLQPHPDECSAHYPVRCEWTGKESGTMSAINAQLSG